MSYLGSTPVCCRPNYLGFNVDSIGTDAGMVAASGPLAPFTAAFLAATQIIPSIGAGRKEADAITPTQNKLGDSLTQVDTIIRTYQLSASDIQNVYNQLNAEWQGFLKFIYQPAFTADGDTRASDQAKATMEPQVNARLTTLSQMLNAVLGRPNPAQVIQSVGAPSLEFRTTSDISLPQAGFVQPGAVAPNPPLTIGAVSPGIDPLWIKLALAGGLVFLLSRR